MKKLENLEKFKPANLKNLNLKLKKNQQLEDEENKTQAQARSRRLEIIEESVAIF